MKDLYRKLGIESGASTTEIAEALERNLELSKYTAILLDEKKREVYNEVHAALKSIGVLRYQLGLDKSDTWFLQNYPDFAPRISLYQPPTVSHKPEPSVPVARQEYEAQPYQRPKHSQPERSNTPVVVGVIVIAIVLAALAFKYF